MSRLQPAATEKRTFEILSDEDAGNELVTMSVPHTVPPKVHGDDQAWLAMVRKQVNSLRFGSVQIVVHDSGVLQIEKTERMRLQQSQLQPSCKMPPLANDSDPAEPA